MKINQKILKMIIMIKKKKSNLQNSRQRIQKFNLNNKNAKILNISNKSLN